ncbi:MAG: GDSL-type esterase/lipase family protein [Tepidisphaeraceae bacterium]|jgi:beta-glucosidase
MRGFVVGFLAGFLSIGACAIGGPATVPSTQAAALPPEPVPSEPADQAAPKLGKDGNVSEYFMKMHIMFLQQRALGGIDVLFLGDSITDDWRKPGPRGGKEIWDKVLAPLNAANFGIRGDKTQNVLWRLDHGEVDGISPKVVVLLIGTNNIAYPADDILLGEMKIVQEIQQKLPRTRLLILGIFPRGNNPKDPIVARMREKIKTVNTGLAQLDDGNMTRFLDLGDKFLDEKGFLLPDVMPDEVHLNARGYQIWADGMLDTLNDMLR